MQIRMNAEDAALWAAKQYISLVAPAMSDRQRRVIERIETFNMIARGGIILPTVFLVMGAVSLFFSVESALIYFGFAIILRKTMGEAWEDWVYPRQSLASRFGLVSDDDRDRALFDKLGIEEPVNWRQTQWIINLCGVSFWQSLVPWPKG